MLTTMEGKILVTGASGFVGGAVCKALLAEGYSVRGTGRRPRPDSLEDAVEYVAGDLSDSSFVGGLFDRVVAVVHVAAKAGVWGDLPLYYQANVIATRVLLEESQRAGVQAFVFTSTPSVVFNGKPIRNGNEELPYGSKFPCAYPTTKAEAEQMVLAANSPAMRTLALRPHLIWGPGDPHLFPRVFERVDAGKLKIVGDGENRVDLTYIDNVAEGHLAALRSLLQGEGGGRAYFLTQDEPVPLWPFINRVLKATGRKPLQKRVPLPVAYGAGVISEGIWQIFQLGGEPPMTRFVAKELATDHWFSSKAAREVLGYRPTVSMEEGLERYLADL